jgi:diguanylate cyclase (GGDEF)-like protein
MLRAEGGVSDMRALVAGLDGNNRAMLAGLTLLLLLVEGADALAQSGGGGIAGAGRVMLWPGLFTIANMALLAAGLRPRGRAAEPRAAPAARDDAGVVEQVRLIRRDPLTSLSNRRAFEARLSSCLASGAACTVLLLDIDQFRKLNDRFGFQAGDALLQQVGDRLRQAVPDSNSIAHLFSDDFAILHTGPQLDAEALALHVQLGFEAPFVCDTGTPVLSACIGIAMAPQHGHDAASLLQAANHALQIAQGNGHGTWRIFDSAAEATAASLRVALPAALAAGEIVPFYQPIVDITTGHVVGLEVLARWLHPGRGLLPPSMFVGLAEEAGLLSDITRALLARTERDSVGWPRDLFYAFNIAQSQLAALPAIVSDSVVPGGLPLQNLAFELTEGEAVADMVAAADVVADLRRRGVRVALDDFGAGFGNFHHLRGISFDTVKIDQEFVLEVLTDPRADFCVRAAVELGHMMGMDIAAEGVDKPEIAARVAALGCRYVQGRLFSMPVPARDVPDLLARLTQPSRPRESRAATLLHIPGQAYGNVY